PAGVVKTLCPAKGSGSYLTGDGLPHPGGEKDAARQTELHLPPRWSRRDSGLHGDKPTEVAEVKRLMIVADNSFAAQSIRLALRQTAGFQVIGFVDGSIPISTQAAELAPDVVVVDDTQEPAHAIARLEELKT